MKFFTAVVTSSLFASIAAAADCTPQDLASLATNPETRTCVEQSGVNFSTLTQPPTSEQSAAICNVDACTNVLNSVLSSNPPDCVLPGSSILYRSQFLDVISTYCQNNNAGVTSGSSTGSVAAGDSSSNAVVGDSSTIGTDNSASTVGSASSVGSDTVGSGSAGSGSKSKEASGAASTSFSLAVVSSVALAVGGAMLF